MEKLDKVIAGLECCGTDAAPDRCPSCPYEHSIDLTCVADLMDDALELLKDYRNLYNEMHSWLRIPFKVDNTVYYYDDCTGVVLPGVVSKVTIGDAYGNGFVHVDFEETDLKEAIVDLKLWGVVLFPTREAAEEANHGND